MQRRRTFARSSSSQITRKPRSFFPFSISYWGSLAPPVSSFFTLETTPKVQDKEVRNRKKSKMLHERLCKVGTFFLVFPSEEKERKRERDTNRQIKTKSFKIWGDVRRRDSSNTKPLTQQPNKQERIRRRRRRRRSQQNHLPKSPKLQPKIKLKISLVRQNLWASIYRFFAQIFALVITQSSRESAENFSAD